VARLRRLSGGSPEGAARGLSSNAITIQRDLACPGTACLKEWGRVKSRGQISLGDEAMSSCVGARVVRRCGVKVERPQRSEDERP
jgi:hypothetical protein